jgi:hypothetical protein
LIDWHGSDCTASFAFVWNLGKMIIDFHILVDGPAPCAEVVRYTNR